MALRSRRSLSPAEQRHAEWLAMLQPQGLLVSPAVLVEAGAWASQPPALQYQLRSLCPEDRWDRPRFSRFLEEILGWPAARLSVATEAWKLSAASELRLALQPDLVLLDSRSHPLIFVKWVEEDGLSGLPLDQRQPDSQYTLSRQSAWERLLLDVQERGGCPIGIHACPTAIRLTYAPPRESPASLTFPLDALLAHDGRILLDALLMLVGADRLFNVPTDARLLPLLRRSRQRQAEVSMALAGQVEEALGALVHGFDQANQESAGVLLQDLDTRHIQNGLTTLVLRLVFLLYCEDRADSTGKPILPVDDPFYSASYSVRGLADRLREEQSRYQETQAHRYGAWAALLATFRVVFAGATYKSAGGEEIKLPPRQGELFDPDLYPFLEGRPAGSHWKTTPSDPPRLSDAVIHSILQHLTVLEGHQLSYRNLDVEQIGGVYEGLMELKVGRSPTSTLRFAGGGTLALDRLEQALNLYSVLGEATGRKAKELEKQLALRQRPVGPDAWLVALRPLLDEQEPVIRQGSLYLHAGSERGQTGSHYTPRDITAPVVERCLRPLVERHGPPTVKHILSLRICDPAMGSGAFLAAACRYLGERLREAELREERRPDHPDRDPLLDACRRVAENCLYGVDKNPFAVTLARLTLWLATLARDAPFTFLDHALVRGDALVGLSLRQLADLRVQDEESGKHKDSKKGKGAQLFLPFERDLDRARENRAQILHANLFSWQDKTEALHKARAATRDRRLAGDLLLALHWAPGSDGARKALIRRVIPSLQAWLAAGNLESRLDAECRSMLQNMHPDPDGFVPDPVPPEHPEGSLRPFHWELEFPEVFERSRGGFDAVIGNPPFITGRAIRGSLTERYPVILAALRPHSHGNADLVAQFFLRAREILRPEGCFGLVATNTVKEGDTRQTGLQFLATHGITFYGAETNRRWSGDASVFVDIVFGIKGGWTAPKYLNGTLVDAINSALEGDEELEDPKELKENADKSFQGTIVLGMGFVLEPVEAEALLKEQPANSQILRPYIGGEELNSNPPGPEGYIAFDRYVINFFDRDEEDCYKNWPELYKIVEERVKPERTRQKEDGSFQLRSPLPQRWWQFADKRPALYRTIAPLRRCLVTARVSKYHLITFMPVNMVFSDGLVVFAMDDWFSFAVMQSRVHQYWARTMGSSMKTDTRYTPSTCFETFPFPKASARTRQRIAEAGRALYEYRAELMRMNGEGMTKLWNQLEDPANTDPEIEKLRDLRLQMDQAVLTAYGWTDLKPEDSREIVRRLRKLNVARAAGLDEPEEKMEKRELAYGPYLSYAKIRNCKRIKELDLDFRRPEDPVGPPRMWTVIIGENGTCKTSVLQALALAAVGDGQTTGEICNSDHRESFIDRRGQALFEVRCVFRLTNGDLGWKNMPLKVPDTWQPQDFFSEIRLNEERELKGNSRYIGGLGFMPNDNFSIIRAARNNRSAGWLVLGYGINRSLPVPGRAPALGPGSTTTRLGSLFGTHDIIGTGFSEDFSSKKLKRYNEILGKLIKQAPDLFPGIQRITLKGKGNVSQATDRQKQQQVTQEFVKGQAGIDLPTTWLSHGFQSSIAWIADLVGWFVLETDDNTEAEHINGLVLIDEIDLFLHPIWQAQIVRVLKEVFPRVQFVATTHSPLVLSGLRPDVDEVIRLEIDPKTGDVVQKDMKRGHPHEPDARLMTATETFRTYFGLTDLFPAKIGNLLREHRSIAANPYRTDAEDARLDVLEVDLRKEGVEPDFPRDPRKTDEDALRRGRRA